MIERVAAEPVRRFPKRPASFARAEMQRDAGQTRRLAQLEGAHDTELIEYGSGLGRYELATDFVTRERRFFKQANRPILTSGGNGGSRARWSGANNFDGRQ